MWAGLLPLYEELQSRGVEVIYDDRQVSAGIMFSDADLLGVPLWRWLPGISAFQRK